MAKSNGFQTHTTPIHKTNNLFLRFIANNIFRVIASKFLRLSLRIYFRDEDGIQPMTPALKRRMKVYIKLEHIFSKPYDMWGTMYELDLDAMKKDLSGPGWDDYDEYGIPYWDYEWHEDPSTGDAWRIAKKIDTNRTA